MLNVGMKHSYLEFGNAKEEIVGLLKKTTESQIKVGKILSNLKKQMNTAIENYVDTKKFPTKKFKEKLKIEYQDFIESLPFGEKVANKFIQIAEDPMINEYVDIAPFAYNTLYAIKGKTKEQWEFLKGKGMTTGTTLAEIKTWLKEHQKGDSEENKTDSNPTGEELSDAMKHAKSITGGKVISPMLDGKVDATSSEKPEFKEFYTSFAVQVNDNVNEVELKQVINEVIDDFIKTSKLEPTDIVMLQNPWVLSDNPNAMDMVA